VSSLDVPHAEITETINHHCGQDNWSVFGRFHDREFTWTIRKLLLDLKQKFLIASDYEIVRVVHIGVERTVLKKNERVHVGIDESSSTTEYRIYLQGNGYFLKKNTL